ncbi:MAG: phosphate acyltransferase, partial [Spirochaetota bacterium]
MDFIDNVRTKAKKLQRTLVLPEGTEPRTIGAARQLVDDGLAGKVVLLGAPAEVEAAAKQVDTKLDGIDVVDPTASDRLDAYAQEYHELRRHKGMTPEQAREGIVEPLRYGAMMVRLGDADA